MRTSTPFFAILTSVCVLGMSSPALALTADELIEAKDGGAGDAELLKLLSETPDRELTIQRKDLARLKRQGISGKVRAQIERRLKTRPPLSSDLLVSGPIKSIFGDANTPAQLRFGDGQEHLRHDPLLSLSYPNLARCHRIAKGQKGTMRLKVTFDMHGNSQKTVVLAHKGLDTKTRACFQEAYKVWNVRAPGTEMSVELPIKLPATPGSAAHAKPSPQVEEGKPSVNGALDKKSIHRTIRRHRDEVRFCYEKELAKDPDLEGKVTVRFVISGNGKVVSAVTRSTTLKNKKVESCLTKEIRRWRFPKPKSNTVSVSYPFIFKSQ